LPPVQRSAPSDAYCRFKQLCFRSRARYGDLKALCHLWHMRFGVARRSCLDEP